MATISVTAIATTPVKGLALHARDRVELGPLGVTENRCFYLVDSARRLVNGKRVGELTAVTADYDSGLPALTLGFPDGTVLSEEVRERDAVETRFFSDRPIARPVCPVLSAALSEFSGVELTIVRADPRRTGIDRGPDGVVSVMSVGSLAHLAGLAEKPVDGRRFRMLFEVAGLAPHGEDSWVGRDVRFGSALVHFGGHVGRCRVTSMDPDSGKVTLATLDLLRYRNGLATTEPLAFGIYGKVLEPGTVSIGDPVSAI